MSRPTLTIRAAVLKLRPTYTCVDCGALGTGDTVTLELGASSRAELLAALSRSPVSNQYMPIGWAGYGIDIHRCPKCAK